MPFLSLKEVKDYMIDLQLGRRNLTPQQTSYFRGLRYNLEKLKKENTTEMTISPRVGLMVKMTEKSIIPKMGLMIKIHFQPPKKLAKEYKVGRNTILRDAEFAAGLDKLDNDLKNAVLSGEIKIGKADIQKLAKTQESELIDSTEKLEGILTEKEPALFEKNMPKAELEATKKMLVKAFEKIKNLIRC
jgi:hypothetical protein